MSIPTTVRQMVLKVMVQSHAKGQQKRQMHYLMHLI